MGLFLLVSLQSRFERATRSLATFVRSHCSLHSLAPQRCASLRSLRSLFPFTGSFTQFAHSLEGQLEFMNMCSRCKCVQQEETRFWSSLETRPMSFFFLFLHIHVTDSIWRLKTFLRLRQLPDFLLRIKEFVLQV